MNEIYSLKRDFLISLIFVIVVSILTIIFNFNYSLGESELNLLLPLLAGTLGVLVTIAAILYVFEESFENNEAIKILKAEDKYDEIFKRFVDSIVGIFYSLIILIAIYFFRAHFLDGNKLNYLIFCIIVLTLIFFVILRAYRCFFVFKSLQEAVSR